MEIGIQHILVFCIVQTVILIAILLQKRFHQLPNLFLGLVFGLLISLYTFYLIEYLGLFDSLNSLRAVKRTFEMVPPPLIYTYMLLLLSGDASFKKEYLKHFTVPIVAIGILLILFILYILSVFPDAVIDKAFFIYMVVGAVLCGVLFYNFGYRIVLLIRSKTRENKNLIQCLFQVKEKRYRWARLMALLYFVHGTIFYVECAYFINSPESTMPLLINTVFYITLGYVLTINLIQNPTIIHFSTKTAGTLTLKKYEKSGLTEDDAKEIMSKLNLYMQTEKPYLNSHLSSQELSDALAIPVHTISEVTNGLMGQNFFDYVNNYRIEEFKRLAGQTDKKNIKIIHLAYEAGFSSKASFNTAFKKFTNTTPSQFIKDLDS